MKVMDDYTGIAGRAPYVQGSQIRQFTIWSKKADRKPMLYVYVPNAQVDHDLSLKVICEPGINVGSGYMVTVPRWESAVTPDGHLIPGSPIGAV